MSARIPMSTKQRNRCVTLYCQARAGLEALADERLNLDGDTRDALNACRGALERFDAKRMGQPIILEGLK